MARLELDMGHKSKRTPPAPELTVRHWPALPDHLVGVPLGCGSQKYDTSSRVQNDPSA